jgi:hypothetical protein
MVTLRKAIVVAGFTCLLLTGFGIVDLDDGDGANTPAMTLTVHRNPIPASTRGKLPSLIQVTVAVGTAAISSRRTAEGILDLHSRECRSHLQSFCLLRC